MASELVKTVTDQSFDAEVLKSDVPVLLDFTATWCGPCKALSPIVDKIASGYAGRLKVAKIDIDESQATPANFQVRGVPTVILFKGGKEVGRSVGLAPESKLVAMFQSHLG